MNPTTNTIGDIEQLQKGSARYLYLPAMVAAIGGLLFGFDTAVINGAIVFIKQQFGLSNSQTEIAASSLLLGCVVGASVAAFTSDRFGRKRVLLVAATLFTISSIGAALPRNLIEFAVARLLVVAPMVIKTIVRDKLAILVEILAGDRDIDDAAGAHEA